MRCWGWIAALALAACGDDGAKKDTSEADTTATETTSTTETTTGDDTRVDDTESPDTSAPLDTLEPQETTADSETSEPTEVIDDTSDTSEPETDVSEPELAGGCPMATRLGGFQVVDDGEYGYVVGEIADGIVPVSVLEVVLTDGDCTVYRKENPFCEPPCSGAQTCDFDGQCLPFPVPQDLGTVTVTGLATGSSVMTFGPSYFDTGLFHPPYDAGSAITLTSTGGVFTPLAMTGVGPQAFPEDLPGKWVIARDTPVVATWPAPTGEVVTRVELQLLIDQHGNAPASVRCDFADDGEGEVPASIINALLDSGVSGFPSGKLIRQTLDRQEVTRAGGSGCADFSVRMPRSISVDVAGVTPCTNDNQCPIGQYCDEPFEICRDE